ncbi:Integral membrane protein [Coniochaeta hoffmannii]|uniref:Integral membrane protein n=1 Tax=Coniochaeta hoffmannii TaxID=91930 RepID=A0AA38RQ31_9PEZI|nr:Integral membrane protein [Coniochaeta hoffmannii]
MDPAQAATANQSRAHVPIAVVVATLTIATTAVILRSYTRAVLIKQFGYDDIGAIISLLLAIGCGTAVATNTMYGAGHHIWAVNPDSIPKYFRTFYVSIVLYNASLTAVKFTFLTQYYRVFRVKKMQKIIIVAGVLIGCWALSQLLIVIFNCNPVNKFWDQSVSGTCIPNLPFWYINAAGNIVTDVTIFVLPLPVLRHLNLQRPQKILLIGIFSIGFFTCAISIIRIQYLHLSEDTTWDNVDSSCWSITELCSAILCVCLPVLRPLISRLFPHLVTDNRKPSNVDSERTFVNTSNVLHTEDLELQRINSEGDFSDGVFGLEDLKLKRDLESNRPSHESARGHHTGPRVAPPVPQPDKSARLLGLEPSIKTEIKASTPKPPEAASRVPDHGIAVHRDVVIRGLSDQ